HGRPFALPICGENGGEMFLRTLVVAGLAGLLPAVTFADTRIQVCIGDTPQKCPHHQYFAGCGTAVEVVAKTACGFSKQTNVCKLGSGAPLLGVNAVIRGSSFYAARIRGYLSSAARSSSSRSLQPRGGCGS